MASRPIPRVYEDDDDAPLAELDTVPPPASGDAYSAPTRVGSLPVAALFGAPSPDDEALARALAAPRVPSELAPSSAPSSGITAKAQETSGFVRSARAPRDRAGVVASSSGPPAPRADVGARSLASSPAAPPAARVPSPAAEVRSITSSPAARRAPSQVTVALASFFVGLVVFGLAALAVLRLAP